MTVTDIRTRTTRPQPEQTSESKRVAELQEMIRSGRYCGYLEQLKDELDQAKAALAEVRELTATSALAA